MTAGAWLPEALRPVVLRLARADQLAFALAETALAWSRGPDDRGAVGIQQVERTPGILNVEVTFVRPVPPIAAMLFSEAIHHLRAAIDNVVFYLAEKEHGQPLTPNQGRAVAMLIHTDKAKYDAKVRRLGNQGLHAFASDGTLGSRMASLQPFNDDVSVPSIRPELARMMGVQIADAHPLGLIQDYSNTDKHRAIQLVAGRAIIQRDDDWRASVGQGMRQIEVGTVLETVPKGLRTDLELSPMLVLRRPDGTWVGPGTELDGVARHVSDIVIPKLVTGTALPGGLPVEIDLSDTGETLHERLSRAGNVRAHTRVRSVMDQAFVDSQDQVARRTPIAYDRDE